MGGKNKEGIRLVRGYLKPGTRTSENEIKVNVSGEKGGRREKLAEKDLN